jgi:hypothetical protein
MPAVLADVDPEPERPADGERRAAAVQASMT